MIYYYYYYAHLSKKNETMHRFVCKLRVQFMRYFASLPLSMLETRQLLANWLGNTRKSTTKPFENRCRYSISRKSKHIYFRVSMKIKKEKYRVWRRCLATCIVSQRNFNDICHTHFALSLCLSLFLLHFIWDEWTLIYFLESSSRKSKWKIRNNKQCFVCSFSIPKINQYFIINMRVYVIVIQLKFIIGQMSNWWNDRHISCSNDADSQLSTLFYDDDDVDDAKLRSWFRPFVYQLYYVIIYLLLQSLGLALKER